MVVFLRGFVSKAPLSNHIPQKTFADGFILLGTMDIATALDYTGIDPFTKQEVYVAKEVTDREIQRALMQFFKPENDWLCGLEWFGGSLAHGVKALVDVTSARNLLLGYFSASDSVTENRYPAAAQG